MFRRSAPACSAFASVKMGPPDAIFGLTTAFKADTDPTKVNLGAGVYRDDNNKPYVLECVRKAAASLTYPDMDYAGITGIPSFVATAQTLAFADSIPRERLSSGQSISGTGALRLAATFMGRHYPSVGGDKIYLPKPTWGNHTPIFKDGGLHPEGYTYYDPTTKGINMEGLLKDFKALPERSMVLLHACAHNPTGVDPTKAQWREILDVVKSRNLFPVIDMAYQGFASGCLEEDAYALRLFAAEVPNLILCQSMAKNFGLYGQRCGAVHFLCEDKAEAARVTSQLNLVVRPMYSNPPIHGAKIVDAILEDPALTQQWHTELKGMADRMNNIRKDLVSNLAKEGSQLDWSHITNQIGMMAYTGMTKDQVATLKSKHHIYMTDDGRAAISGVNSKNVEYIAKCFHDVTK